MIEMQIEVPEDASDEDKFNSQMDTLKGAMTLKYPNETVIVRITKKIIR